MFEVLYHLRESTSFKEWLKKLCVKKCFLVYGWKTTGKHLKWTKKGRNLPKLYVYQLSGARSTEKQVKIHNSVGCWTALIWYAKHIIYFSGSLPLGVLVPLTNISTKLVSLMLWILTSKWVHCMLFEIGRTHPISNLLVNIDLWWWPDNFFRCGWKR